jgi:hypothetical protein
MDLGNKSIVVCFNSEIYLEALLKYITEYLNQNQDIFLVVLRKGLEITLVGDYLTVVSLEKHCCDHFRISGIISSTLEFVCGSLPQAK